MFFFPTMYNTQFNIQFNSFIVHSMLQKKCNQLLHELDMFEKARNIIKLDSIQYFYLEMEKLTRSSKQFSISSTHSY